MMRIEPWWNVFPFVRLMIPFVLGIVSPPGLLSFLFPACLTFFVLTLLFLKIVPIYLQYKFRSLRGLALHLLLFVFGISATFLHDLRNHPLWFAKHPYHGLLVEVKTEPGSTKTGYSLNAVILKRLYEDQWHSAVGKIRIRISGTNQLLYPGSLLFIDQPAQPPENRPNSEFDYRAYLANHNIYHQVSLRYADIRVIRKKDNPPGSINRLRSNILSLLNRSFSDLSERALAKALLVGDRSELERSLVAAYTDTGVIHVVAISGLHLGLIYGMLLIILKPFVKHKRTKLSANVIIAGALWVFTMICGASPSVVRSAVMFSSLLVGDSIGSDNNTENALASSAFLLLCYDPFLLHDVGFQLSYAAVASLLIFNRAVNSLFQARNALLLHAWSSISTSISAQILTTPIVLFHFHQFPVVFILSNLVAVPVSGMILFLLILLCLLQPITTLSQLIALLSSWLIRFMNNQVGRIATLPFATWRNIQWQTHDLALSFLAILLFGIYARTRSPKPLIFFLLTILTWLILGKYSI